jgi:hypothetical protein
VHKFFALVFVNVHLSASPRENNIMASRISARE